MNQAQRLKIYRFLAMVIAPILMAGCASVDLDPKKNVDSEPGVRSSLESAMARADKQKEQTRSAQEKADLGSGSMTVIWEGEGAEILSRVAAAQRLEFKITGPQPRLQLPVFVHLKNVSLPQALAAIGEQFGGRADVILTDSTIELRMKMY